MREDENIAKAARQQRFLECGPDRDNPCEGTGGLDEGYGTVERGWGEREGGRRVVAWGGSNSLPGWNTGCCTLSNQNSGMTTEGECARADANASWVELLCDENNIITLR